MWSRQPHYAQPRRISNLVMIKESCSSNRCSSQLHQRALHRQQQASWKNYSGKRRQGQSIGRLMSVTQLGPKLCSSLNSTSSLIRHVLHYTVSQFQTLSTFRLVNTCAVIRVERNNSEFCGNRRSGRYVSDNRVIANSPPYILYFMSIYMFWYHQLHIKIGL